MSLRGGEGGRGGDISGHTGHAALSKPYKMYVNQLEHERFFILYEYHSSRIFGEELLKVASLLWLSVDFELLSQSLEGALHF